MATASDPNLGYEVGIICALPLEATAVKGIFDEIYEVVGDNGIKKARGDIGSYTTGKIGHHKVVLGHMAGISKVNAAAVAQSFLASFGGLRLVLLVGICGAIPRGIDGSEIVLGDVVIAKNVIQTDFGSQYDDGFARKQNAEDSLGKHAAELFQKPGYEDSMYFGTKDDRLFSADYLHKHRQQGRDCDCKEPGRTCALAKQASCDQLGCSSSHLLFRERLRDDRAHRLAIHLGTVASSEAVMKSVRHRNNVAEAEKAIAFEMEGAGLWDSLPSNAGAEYILPARPMTH
ncbi:nucleoside phosphorylase domain-containing protein [Aspergillus karnatakaensis]|uniref:nucleoside phosphorylase domain-containing protein n=1 Tax=Aspergillus karnatakaensis TaxID=1810916 RepID=UPI003CCDBA0F